LEAEGHERKKEETYLFMVSMIHSSDRGKRREAANGDERFRSLSQSDFSVEESCETSL